MSSRDKKTQRMARLSLLIAVAMIFSYIEAIVPYNPGIPGVKLGLANLVTVIALYIMGPKEAVTVSVIRVLISGLLFNGAFAAMYALAGAVLSLAGMIALKRTGLFSIAGVSMAGGVLHNLGQLIVAALIIEDLKMFFYFPVLLFSGIIAGIAIGIAASLLQDRLRRALRLQTPENY